MIQALDPNERSGWRSYLSIRVLEASAMAHGGTILMHRGCEAVARLASEPINKTRRLEWIFASVPASCSRHNHVSGRSCTPGEIAHCFCRRGVCRELKHGSLGASATGRQRTKNELCRRLLPFLLKLHARIGRHQAMFRAEHRPAYSRLSQRDP